MSIIFHQNVWGTNQFWLKYRDRTKIYDASPTVLKTVCWISGSKTVQTFEERVDLKSRCRMSTMYSLGKTKFDTTENEHSTVWQYKNRQMILKKCCSLSRVQTWSYAKWTRIASPNFSVPFLISLSIRTLSRKQCQSRAREQQPRSKPVWARSRLYSNLFFASTKYY